MFVIIKIEIKQIKRFAACSALLFSCFFSCVAAEIKSAFYFIKSAFYFSFSCACSTISESENLKRKFKKKRAAENHTGPPATLSC